MIKSFKSKIAEAIFNREVPKGFPAMLVKTARRRLEAVNAANALQDLRSPPGNKLHALRDGRAGQHAIRINDQYRICFVWAADGPREVEIVDYH